VKDILFSQKSKMKESKIIHVIEIQTKFTPNDTINYSLSKLRQRKQNCSPFHLFILFLFQM